MTYICSHSTFLEQMVTMANGRVSPDQLSFQYHAVLEIFLRRSSVSNSVYRRFFKYAIYLLSLTHILPYLLPAYSMLHISKCTLEHLEASTMNPDRTREQFDLGPYCLQYRLPKSKQMRSKTTKVKGNFFWLERLCLMRGLMHETTQCAED